MVREKERLTKGLRELVEMRWSELVAMEQDPTSTNYTLILTQIAQSARNGNLRALQTSLDRLDGKIAQKVEIVLPKFYTRYPNALKTADDDSIIDVPQLEKVVEVQRLDSVTAAPTEYVEEDTTGKLRPVLEQMVDAERSVVDKILGAAEIVDGGDTSYGDPRVKSVMVAGLMKLVHNGKIGAVFEIMEQLDGKIVDKLEVMGKDVYMTSYAEIAPAGATKNEQGVYQMEAPAVSDTWGQRLQQDNRR